MVSKLGIRVIGSNVLVAVDDLDEIEEGHVEHLGRQVHLGRLQVHPETQMLMAGRRVDVPVGIVVQVGPRGPRELQPGQRVLMVRHILAEWVHRYWVGHVLQELRLASVRTTDWSADERRDVPNADIIAVRHAPGVYSATGDRIICQPVERHRPASRIIIAPWRQHLEDMRARELDSVEFAQVLSKGSEVSNDIAVGDIVTHTKGTGHKWVDAGRSFISLRGTARLRRFRTRRGSWITEPLGDVHGVVG